MRRRAVQVAARVLGTLALLLVFAAPAQAGGATVERTMEALSRVPGITAEQLESGREMIKTLDYINMRVFRALCALPDITAAEALRLLPGLAGEPINYEHLQLFEQFCTLKGVSVAIALQALREMADLDYVTVWAGVSLCRIPALGPDQALAAIRLLRTLHDPARWAAKAFFEIGGQTADTVGRGLDSIRQFSADQCWAAEANSRIAAITVQQALLNMAAISRISRENIMNAKALLGLEGMTGPEAHVWLTGYFSKSPEEHDADYRLLPAGKKTLLQQAYLDASDHPVRAINNLHSVTNSDGDEISDAQLASYSFGKLAAFFTRFPPETRSRFEARFSGQAKNGEKGAAIATLRQATAFARMETARRLSTANIYVLMTRVSVLYDSSFRLILIPELHKRIAAEYHGSLLRFMQDVDPENVQVANFVSSLALKARLSMFLPADTAGQQEIIDLVLISAFKDENNLVLFAATFEKLLHGILPATRAFLIDRMIFRARNPTIFARLVRTILQYYLEAQLRILGAENAVRIREVLAQYDSPPLAKYGRTPFAEWRKDGLLSGLSVFHGDDDGRNSFVANCALLLSRGYLPRPSQRFSGAAPAGGFEQEQLAALLRTVGRRENGDLARLYKFLKSTPLVVDFVKTVNNLQISHSLAVYHDGATQQRLLAQFIRDGHEMYAPRGHSYWLNDHILNPLQALVRDDLVSSEELAAKHRFISIGACGGLKVYADLTGVFCNRVDMLASLGAGKTSINNLYNLFLFETVATAGEDISWGEMDRRAAAIFAEDPEKDYQLPGELPAILYKILGKRKCWFRFYREE
jgi:hypothetical protein